MIIVDSEIANTINEKISDISDEIEKLIEIEIDERSTLTANSNFHALIEDRAELNSEFAATIRQDGKNIATIGLDFKQCDELLAAMLKG